MWHVCVVCFSSSAVNWVARTRQWSCCRPLSCFFLGHLHCALIHQGLPPWHAVVVIRSSTSPSLPPRSTTLTYCHGDEGVDFALTSTKVYHSDILPWWWGRLLCPHFHQGLPLWHIAMVMRALTLPSLPPRSTTLTYCHGDEGIDFALTSTKVYYSDILPWWWGRLLCPHFHQGLASYHPVMLLWCWYHRHWTLPWMSTRLSPWHVVMVIGWSMSPSLSSRMTTLTCCHGDVVTHTGHSSVYRCCVYIFYKIIQIYIYINI